MYSYQPLEPGAPTNSPLFLHDIDLQLDSGVTVRKAWIGYVAEGGSLSLAVTPSYTPINIPFTTLNINFNSNLVTQNIMPTNREIATPFWDETHDTTYPGIMQYADITTLVSAKGSGKYQIANQMTDQTNQVLLNCPAPFLIVVEERADFPYTNTIVDDYFYSNTDNSPQNFIVSENLPANYVFDVTQNTKIATFGQSYDYSMATLAGGNPAAIPRLQFGDDIASANYQEFDANGKIVAGGEIINSLTGVKNAFYSAQSWNDVEIRMNAAAKVIELHILNDGCGIFANAGPTETEAEAEARVAAACLANDGHGGSTEVAGFLILQIALEIDEDGDGEPDKCPTNPDMLASDPDCMLTVTFDTNCADTPDNCPTNPDNQDVPFNGAAKEPAKPTRDGFMFEHWFVCEADDKTPFDFATRINADLSLCGKWLADELPGAPDTGVIIGGSVFTTIATGVTVTLIVRKLSITTRQ